MTYKQAQELGGHLRKRTREVAVLADDAAIEAKNVHSSPSPFRRTGCREQLKRAPKRELAARTMPRQTAKLGILNPEGKKTPPIQSWSTRSFLHAVEPPVSRACTAAVLDFAAALDDATRVLRRARSQRSRMKARASRADQRAGSRLPADS
jgi:hypothetical protein